MAPAPARLASKLARSAASVCTLYPWRDLDASTTALHCTALGALDDGTTARSGLDVSHLDNHDAAAAAEDEAVARLVEGARGLGGLVVEAR